jgi:signal transduction histidine kinase/ActR/RegA family two-component response regulator
VTGNLLLIAALLQCGAVGYGIYLLTRRRGAMGAWLFLLGAMLSMLVWRVMVVTNVIPPPFFNPLIAIWGSTCMVGAMFLFGREVQARKRAEDERDALLESERAARIVAEDASRAKDEFLATLSHELRSPLAAILGWCNILQRASPPARDIEHGLTVIERNARAQSRLVDDLLDVTRMRSGKLQLEADTLPMGAPVRAAIQAVSPRAASKQVTVKSRIDGDGPSVIGDADRLRQVVTNLLENAVRFTPTGGCVTVTLSERDGCVELAVADTGEGIDADFMPHVFTRFRQADGSTRRRHGGLGIGLSIVDHLVRLHGGHVRAESKGAGQGATFFVTLPATSAKVATGKAPAPLMPLIGQPLQGLRLLLVDDEEDVRRAATRILEQLGATVTAAASGERIREQVIATQPHLLIFDVGMPEEDGYSLISRVRQFPPAEGGRIPAISLTAHARSEDRSRALAAGFNEHLPKPIDILQLVTTIHALTMDACTATRATPA